MATTTQSSSAIPLIALKNKVLFPGEVVSLVFEREQSLEALNYALEKEIQPVFVFQKDDSHEIRTDNLYSVGTIASIIRIWRMPEGPTGVLVEGKDVVTIHETIDAGSFLWGVVNPIEIPSSESNSVEIEALTRNIITVFKEIINLGVSVPLSIMNEIINDAINPNRLSYLIASILTIKNSDKQEILEITDVNTRLQKINLLITKEKEVLEVGQKVQKETQKQVGRFAREAMLREQMKAIERELGMNGEQSEFADLKKKIKLCKMPKNIEKKALHELSRLEKMPPFSPESSYVQNYLEVMISIPWSKKKKVSINLNKAQEVLDEDHYGLQDIKESIIEYLAVEKLTKKPQGTILCFFGPPGTGKTSIGESIAKATGREFTKISLGGIRDETEIRGHRRTYVGAMPGRIIQGFRSISTTNPVFMLDEIDKLGSDFRGDPSAALLEVLDPAQNMKFVDHYLDVEYDLSDTIFVTTANDLSTIPEPLLDRMEIIEFSGYTVEEKIHIAEQYLIPRVLKKSGITNKILVFSRESLETIITKYTYEAGLRSLERELSKIARKVAKDYLQNTTDDFSVKITPKKLEKYLKAEKFEESFINKDNEVGISTGLGWSPYGGSILFIETNLYRGDGKLQLTGRLSKVMQESAQTAYSYVRSNADMYGIELETFKNYDIHIHFPSGAVSKDGPSAGLAIATSIVSALTKKPVNRLVAMTGEINLRGRALKIGGLKNKILAAHRAGITTVIIPKANQVDLEDIPSNVKDDLTFVIAESMNDIVPVAIVS